MTTAVTPAADRGNQIDVTQREGIEHALTRVLESGYFRKCTQLSRFLRFAVTQALAGPDGVSKETLIGVEIFGRPPDYDPATDPVVRVEARRLRDKLAQYYRSEGREDPLRIDLPKGSYSPVFEAQCVREPTPRSIAVLPFADHSAERTLGALSDGLTARLIARLALHSGLRVVSSTSVFRFREHAEDPCRLGAQLHAELLLEGSLRKSGSRFRCDTQLISSSDGLHLWAGSFDCGSRSLFAVEDAFASGIGEGVSAASRANFHARPSAVQPYSDSQ
jgi:TolB-like protein